MSAGGAQRELRHRRAGACVARHRLHLAVARAAGPVLRADLPVAARHVVAGGEEHLPAQHGDAPVEVGGEELLGDEQRRAAEHLRADRAGTPRSSAHLCTAAEKEPSGSLTTTGQPSSPTSAHERARGDHQGARRGDALAAQQLLQEDLVAAADDRLRVVDHRHVEHLGAQRELEGGLAHAGERADEEGVVLAQLVDLVEADAVQRRRSCARPPAPAGRASRGWRG